MKHLSADLFYVLLYTPFRTNASEIATIKEHRPDHRLPFGALSGGSDSVHELVMKFTKTRIADSHNDKMPKNSRRVSLRTKKLLGEDGEPTTPLSPGENSNN